MGCRVVYGIRWRAKALRRVRQLLIRISTCKERVLSKDYQVRKWPDVTLLTCTTKNPKTEAS